MMAFLFEVGVTNALLTAILAIVVFAITRVWTNPHLGRFLWLVVLLKMVTPPLLNVPIPFRWDWNQSEVSTPSSGILDATNLSLSPDDREASTQKVDASTAIEEMPSTLAETQKAPSKVMMSEGPRHVWPVYLGVVWLTGSLVCGLLVGVRIVQFHRKLRETCLARERLQRIGKSVAKELGLKLCPELRITNSRLSPMVWPIGRPPTVVLPNGLVEELDEEQLKTIVAHEYGHIARRDCWVRWLEVVCTVLYWWNPCLWLARRELRQAEELCCDALVMQAYPGFSRIFAESLLKVDDFLSGLPYRAPLLVSEMRGAGQMKRRIEMIVNEKLPPRLSRTIQIMLFASALAILPLSAEESQGERTISSKNPQDDVLLDAPNRIRFYANKLKSNFEKTKTLKGKLSSTLRQQVDAAVFHCRDDQNGIEDVSVAGDFIRETSQAYTFTWDLASDNLVSLFVPSDKPCRYLDKTTKEEVVPKKKDVSIGVGSQIVINSKHAISTSLGMGQQQVVQHHYVRTQSRQHEMMGGSPKQVFCRAGNSTHEFLFAVAKQLQEQESVGVCYLNIKQDLHTLKLIVKSKTTGQPLTYIWVFDASRDFVLTMFESRISELNLVKTEEWTYSSSAAEHPVPTLLTTTYVGDENWNSQQIQELSNLVVNEELAEDTFTLASLGPANGDVLLDKNSGETFVIQDLGKKLVFKSLGQRQKQSATTGGRYDAEF